MRTAFTRLIKVKSIITLMIVAVYCYLCISGTIEPGNVQTIVGMVISFYFGTQHEWNDSTRRVNNMEDARID